MPASSDSAVALGPFVIGSGCALVRPFAIAMMDAGVPHSVLWRYGNQVGHTCSVQEIVDALSEERVSGLRPSCVLVTSWMDEGVEVHDALCQTVNAAIALGEAGEAAPLIVPVPINVYGYRTRSNGVRTAGITGESGELSSALVRALLAVCESLHPATAVLVMPAVVDSTMRGNEHLLRYATRMVRSGPGGRRSAVQHDIIQSCTTLDGAASILAEVCTDGLARVDMRSIPAPLVVNTPGEAVSLDWLLRGVDSALGNTTPGYRVATRRQRFRLMDPSDAPLTLRPCAAVGGLATEALVARIKTEAAGTFDPFGPIFPAVEEDEDWDDDEDWEDDEDGEQDWDTDEYAERLGVVQHVG